MPFALIIIGLVLVVSTVKDTTSDLFTLVKGDFTGKDNFIYWSISILIIGSIGYIQSLQNLSRVFMALVITGLILSNGGFFEKFNEQISQNVTPDSNSNDSNSNDDESYLKKLATPQSWADPNSPDYDVRDYGYTGEQPLVSPRTN